MIIVPREPIRKARVPSVRWIRNEQPDIARQSYRERLQNVVRRLAEEAAELRLVCAVDEEVPEAVVGVHDGDYGAADGAVEREAVVSYV